MSEKISLDSSDPKACLAKFAQQGPDGCRQLRNIFYLCLVAQAAYIGESVSI